MNIEKWIERFENFCKFYNLSRTKQAESIQFYLTNHAHIFYQSLDQGTTINYNAVKRALINRFKEDSTVLDLSILQIKQSESVSDYLGRVFKTAANKK